jgi:hypothetical protein
MNATSSPVGSQSDALGARFRNFAMAALFALVLLLPKLIHIRRNPQSWGVFRVVLGFAGAALVVLPLSLWSSWVAGITGLAMFLLAILLPPAKPDTSLEDTARKLESVVIVNGGRYHQENVLPAAVQLFVGAERVWALDAQLHPLLVIPVSRISSVHAGESANQWILRVRWMDHTADFHYRGVFAEHLARVAESTLRGVMPSSLPILPQRRAASA